MSIKRLVSGFIGITAALIILTGNSLTVSAETEDGLKYLGIGDFKKAEALFNDILIDDAGNKKAAYYLGITCLLQENYTASLGIFNKLNDEIDNSSSNKIPTKGQVEIGLVRSYLGLKKYDEAYKSLKAAEQAGVDQVEILTYKGAWHLEKNENQKAYDELEKAIKLKSNNPYTYYYAGVANMRMGKPQDAVKLFEHFLQMAPYVPEAKNAKILIDTLC